MHSQLQHTACLPWMIITVCLVLVSCYFTMKEISVTSCESFLLVTFCERDVNLLQLCLESTEDFLTTDCVLWVKFSFSGIL